MRSEKPKKRGSRRQNPEIFRNVGPRRADQAWKTAEKQAEKSDEKQRISAVQFLFTTIFAAVR